MRANASSKKSEVMVPLYSVGGALPPWPSRRRFIIGGSCYAVRTTLRLDFSPAKIRILSAETDWHLHRRGRRRQHEARGVCWLPGFLNRYLVKGSGIGHTRVIHRRGCGGIRLFRCGRHRRSLPDLLGLRIEFFPPSTARRGNAASQRRRMACTSALPTAPAR